MNWLHQIQYKSDENIEANPNVELIINLKHDSIRFRQWIFAFTEKEKL